MKTNTTNSTGSESWKLALRWPVLLLLILGVGATGCHSKREKQDQTFFTSGSREADQRATQRMAKAEQLSGSGENGGQGGVKGANPTEGAAARAQGKLSLYERLGGEDGISRIVDDFTPRLLADPRVNWDRKGVPRGGLFHHGKSVTWNPTPQNVATLKSHMVQFLSLATGGPSKYQGGEMKGVHSGMHISNPEFDAAVGDIKASLDKLKVPNEEQKEFLAIVESTRPQIVTER
ncbi:MAG TPA: group 1 truncated hemoglobin [Verrucomicrobiae bacterium]|nr:group 1 truncated hemoglobin [Verrucomicrobiae bacterium]